MSLFEYDFIFWSQISIKNLKSSVEAVENGIGEVAGDFECECDNILIEW